jgi:hypothetical protein
MENSQTVTEGEQVVTTRIRSGRHDDLPALARLMYRANAADGRPQIDEDELDEVARRGELIVLDLQPDELAAAACVAVGRGLVFLVIDPEIASPALEDRMLGVAHALCESKTKPACAARTRGRR